MSSDGLIFMSAVGHFVLHKNGSTFLVPTYSRCTVKTVLLLLYVLKSLPSIVTANRIKGVACYNCSVFAATVTQVGYNRYSVVDKASMMRYGCGYLSGMMRMVQLTPLPHPSSSFFINIQSGSTLLVLLANRGGRE